jgi:folate-dependent phosphoribosylglycinamide formyltransferase PurN
MASKLVKLYNPLEFGQLRVVGLMSGSGTNLVSILEYERLLEKQRGESPFKIPIIFSDNFKSRASEIGAQYSIPVFIYDIQAFYKVRGKPLRDMKTRGEYEIECLNVLNQYECVVAAYAGYMRKATPVFVNSFLGVNVHPADLTIKDDDGRPKYRGNNVVKNAICAHEESISSSTHIVTNDLDCGQVLMVSRPLKIDYKLIDDRMGEVNCIVDKYQEELKTIGDWDIFPKTLEYIADGRYSLDEQGGLFFDGKEMPQGLRLK